MQNGQTIAQSPQVAADVAKAKRADGYAVTITTTGSDSKRGTRPTFIIKWTVR